MKKLKSYALGIAIASLATAAYGGCGSYETTCYHYKKDKLVHQSSCTIAECMNSNFGSTNWDWKYKDISVYIESKEGSEWYLNDKLAFYKPKKKSKSELACYGLKKAKADLYCYKEPY